MQRLANGDLLLTATAGERAVLVRFEAGRERLSIVDAGVEMVEHSSPPKRAGPWSWCAAPMPMPRSGSSQVELQRNRSETLIDTRPEPVRQRGLRPGRAVVVQQFRRR
jgi:hypothetical protein